MHPERALALEDPLTYTTAEPIENALVCVFPVFCCEQKIGSEIVGSIAVHAGSIAESSEVIPEPTGLFSKQSGQSVEPHTVR